MDYGHCAEAPSGGKSKSLRLMTDRTRHHGGKRPLSLWRVELKLFSDFSRYACLTSFSEVISELKVLIGCIFGSAFGGGIP